MIETRVFYDFTDEEQFEDWTTVNDTVMGGVSSSVFERADKTTARFSGTVSLERNGGFASVRTRPMDHGFKSEDGVIVRLKGDGNVYKISFSMSRGFDSIGYQMNFETRKGEWIEVRAPFGECKPSWHGRNVPGAPALEPAKIQRLGFLIADKQAGQFSLLIDSITGYTDAGADESSD